MRTRSTIGLNLGTNWMPCNLSSYWGADQDRAKFAIRRAKAQEISARQDAIINADIRTRFCRKAMQTFMEAADAIMHIRGYRNLTREEDNRLDELLYYHRKYHDRYEYFFSKLDLSAVQEVSRHFWYYDPDTGDVVDDDTGKRYRV